MKYGEMFPCRHPGDLEPSGKWLDETCQNIREEYLNKRIGFRVRQALEQIRSFQSVRFSQPDPHGRVQLCGTVKWWGTLGSAAGGKKNRQQMVRWWKEKDRLKVQLKQLKHGNRQQHDNSGSELCSWPSSFLLFYCPSTLINRSLSKNTDSIIILYILILYNFIAII